MASASKPFTAEIDAASLKKLEYAVESAKKRILEQTEDAVIEVAEATLEAERQAVPVDTGFLHDSLDIKYAKDGQSALIGPQSKKAWYAIFVEWGSSERAPAPFATPAAEQARVDLRTALVKHANDAIEESGA